MILISTKVVYNDIGYLNNKSVRFFRRRQEMSFGINGPDNIPAIQRSHHTNDGGAGNLGYFKRKKDDDDENKDKKNEESDTFEFSGEKEDNEDYLMEELDSIGTKIKNFWLNLNINKDNKKKNPADE